MEMVEVICLNPVTNELIQALSYRLKTTAAVVCKAKHVTVHLLH